MSLSIAPNDVRCVPFLEAVEAHVRRVIAGLPLQKKGPREALLNRFLEKGLPTHKDEEWKYTSLRLLGEATFAGKPDEQPHPSILDTIPDLVAGPRIVFWNGAFCDELSDVGMPNGISFTPLLDATPDGFGEVSKLEGKLGSTNDERFTWLNSAAYQDGAYLDIAEGALIGEPVQIVFLSSGAVPCLTFPRLFIQAGKNSQAKIVEFHVGTGVYASIALAEVDVAPGANLEHIRYQDESPSAFHIGILSARQAENSTYTSNSLQFGARIGRLDADVWVGGEHAETSLNGAYVGTGEQHLDNHTRLDHALPNCHSFEVYKGILGGRASGVFNGKIFVYPDAQKTDAKQTNQALLLSSTATVDTKPQLEIFADDVKCTHGATVGQLREDAMFYLRSRGIPESEARNLLVYAFAAEVIELIGIESLRAAFEERLFAKLREAGQG